MPCAGPDYSCNTLLSIRSPLGEVRLGAPGSAKPAPRPLWAFIRAFRALREMLAHRRQLRVLDELEPRLLEDVGVTPAEARDANRLLTKSARFALDAEGPGSLK
jgi:uncharacterized protein YjiS (DUF1127 family)